MARTVDELPFSLCICTPEYEYEVFALLGKTTDSRIGKRLPPVVLMRGRRPGIDSQR